MARIHPRRPDDTASTAVGPHPEGLVMAGGRLFVASNTRHIVAVLDPERFRRGPLQRLRVPLNPYALASGNGHVWVTGMAGATATRIDP